MIKGNNFEFTCEKSIPQVIWGLEDGKAHIKEPFFQTCTGSTTKGAILSTGWPVESSAGHNPASSIASTHSLEDPSSNGTYNSINHLK